MSNKKVRVRFAPSPTGWLHVGGLRTVLYNFLFARQFTNGRKGTLILRIEDTDRKRLIPQATESLIKVLYKMGIKYQEGAFLSKERIIQKGKSGPYIQSLRIITYRNLAQKLIDEKKAYYCFCSPERLTQLRKEQQANKLAPRYDGHCRQLTKQQIKNNLAKHLPYVIRLKVPDQQEIKFRDLIHGMVSINSQNIDDQILLKSDGWPTYHLANVIDDHLMNITHVIRGEEWLPSTPKHILLYRAFGWQPPQWVHLPLLLNSDRSKLSKRQGDVAVEDFLAKGYLPIALINFVALLGWHPKNDQEIFNLSELTKQFSLERIQKSGAIFNQEKLDWMNGYYLKKLSIKQLTKLCLPYLQQDKFIDIPNKQRIKIIAIQETRKLSWLQKVIALFQQRMKKLSEISSLSKFFFINQLDYPSELLIWKKSDLSRTIVCLNKIIQSLINLKRFNQQHLNLALRTLGKQYSNGEIFWPLRVALTGMRQSPPPIAIALILGKDKTIIRLQEAVKQLNNN